MALAFIDEVRGRKICRTKESGKRDNTKGAVRSFVIETMRVNLLAWGFFFIFAVGDERFLKNFILYIFFAIVTLSEWDVWLLCLVISGYLMIKYVYIRRIVRAVVYKYTMVVDKAFSSLVWSWCIIWSLKITTAVIESELWRGNALRFKCVFLFEKKKTKSTNNDIFLNIFCCCVC